MSKCGEKTEVYSRVCGYFRPVANWNKGKREEFKDRKTFKVTGVLLALFATATLFLLTGCGHNVATFSKGIRAVAGINPDTYTISIGIDYGENVTIAVKEKADMLLSFSDMTFPHQLMRVVLCEQIYRAFMINAGSEYHK